MSLTGNSNCRPSCWAASRARRCFIPASSCASSIWSRSPGWRCTNSSRLPGAFSPARKPLQGFKTASTTGEDLSPQPPALALLAPSPAAERGAVWSHSSGVSQGNSTRQADPILLLDLGGELCQWTTLPSLARTPRSACTTALGEAEASSPNPSPRRMVSSVQT